MEMYEIGGFCNGLWMGLSKFRQPGRQKAPDCCNRQQGLGWILGGREVLWRRTRLTHDSPPALCRGQNSNLLETEPQQRSASRRPLYFTRPSMQRAADSN